MRWGAASVRAAAAVALATVSIACGSSDAPASTAEADAGDSGAPPVAPEAGGTAETGGSPVHREASGIARAAILLGSCRGGGGPLGELAADGQEPPELLYFANGVRFGPEIDAVLAKQLECLGQKTNGCKAIEECTGTTIDTLPCTARCEGAIAETCKSSRRVRVDCARYGKECGFDAVVQRAVCLEPGAESCSGGAFTGACESGRPTGCRSGFEHRGPLCEAYGMVCRPQGAEDENATCTGAGPECKGVWLGSDESVVLGGYLVARCDGPRLVSCYAGREVSYACADLGAGFTCQTKQGASSPSLSFCGAGTECLPGEAKDYDTCDGDAYVICNAGMFERVSCKALGFSRCNVTSQRCAD